MREVLKQVHRSKQVVFGLTAHTDLYLIWAGDLIDRAWRAANAKVVEEIALLHLLEAEQVEVRKVELQLAILKLVQQSNAPAFSVLREEHLLPKPILDYLNIPIRRSGNTNPMGFGSSIDEMIEDKRAELMGWGTSPSNAFACIYICETRKHSWPCAKAGRPPLCKSDKEWTKELIS